MCQHCYRKRTHLVPTLALSLALSPISSVMAVNSEHSAQVMQRFSAAPHSPLELDEHGATHACPMHPEQTGHDGDRCSICNMFLTPIEAQGQEHSRGHDVEHDQHTDHVQPMLSSISAPTNGADKIKYVCPMHPQIISDEPDSCPICGMALEQVTLGGSAEAIVISVAGDMQQTLAIRTEPVKRETLWRYVKTLGTVEYNQDAIKHIHARVNGWIEKLAITDVGQSVRQGELMYELYSPELVTAQDDYLQALSYLKTDRQRGNALLRKARLRLELLGIAPSVIKQLERTGQSVYRVPFYAPKDGFVSALTLRNGMYVQPGDTMIELVDLSSVWIIAEIFENEQSWLQVGRPAEVSASAQGLFNIEGSIDYLYPELDPITRAMQVRIKLDNPQHKLRPGALVDVALFGGPKPNLLTIPTEALILTGRENRVVVQRNETEFASLPVKLGMRSQGRAEVLEGLKQQDRVVVSGQFLLDSEASIQGSLLRLSGSAANRAPTDQHAHH